MSSTIRFISSHFMATKHQHLLIQHLSEFLNLNFAIKTSAKNQNTLKIHCKNINTWTCSSILPAKKTTNKLRDLAVRLGPSLWVFPSNLGEHMIPIKCWSQTCNKLTSRGICLTSSLDCLGILVVLGILVPDINAGWATKTIWRNYFKFDCE